MSAAPPEGSPRVDAKSYQQVRRDFATGDLLCFRSKDLDGRLVRLFTRSDYSHAGIVYLFEGRVYCIEAVTSGVRLVLMSRRAKAYNGGIDYFRVKDVSEEQRRGAVGFAFQQLGERYNTSGILRFLWFLISGNKERIRQRRGWFCSEIVAEAYRRQKAPLVDKHAAGYVSPADLAISPRVELAFRIKDG